MRRGNIEKWGRVSGVSATHRVATLVSRHPWGLSWDVKAPMGLVMGRVKAPLGLVKAPMGLVMGRVKAPLGACHGTCRGAHGDGVPNLFFAIHDYCGEGVILLVLENG